MRCMLYVVCCVIRVVNYVVLIACYSVRSAFFAHVGICDVINIALRHVLRILCAILRTMCVVCHVLCDIVLVLCCVCCMGCYAYCVLRCASYDTGVDICALCCMLFIV